MLATIDQQIEGGEYEGEKTRFEDCRRRQETSEKAQAHSKARAVRGGDDTGCNASGCIPHGIQRGGHEAQRYLH